MKKAKGKLQKAKGKGEDALRAKNYFCLLPLAFCLLFRRLADFVRAGRPPAPNLKGAL